MPGPLVNGIYENASSIPGFFNPNGVYPQLNPPTSSSQFALVGAKSQNRQIQIETDNLSHVSKLSDGSGDVEVVEENDIGDVTLEGSQQYSMFDEMMMWNSHLVDSILDPQIDLYDGLQEQKYARTFKGN